ncbi:alpha/beta hydrolase [Deinococcus sp.]|uniref:alpha/beta hydrolase n=1 Tax=Deinococcus sp. TaxID=47478 RepID=UPI003CC529DC
MKKRLLLPLLAASALAVFAACSPLVAINAVVSTSNLSVTPNLPYGPDVRNLLDVYQPASASRAPVVLFIHGGSWDSGSKDDYKFVGESFAREGYLVAIMNYRLAPKNPYPAYIQDAAQALKWLRGHAAEYGGNPDDLFVMGHSAGAFNAVEVVDNARWLSEAGVPISAVHGVIGVAGPYSYDYRGMGTASAFPAGSDPADVMPANHVRADAPPHLLLVAANDQVVYPQNGERMKAALEARKIPLTFTVLPNLDHYTIVGSLARSLTFLGKTRQEVLDFLKANR